MALQTQITQIPRNPGGTEHDRNLHTHNHISLISCSGYNFFCCSCLCEGSIYIFGKPSDISKSYVDKILHI